MEKYKKEEIALQVDETVNKIFDKEFSFRKYQKEAVVDTIYNWLNGTKSVIMQAPTGSGKSITAMIIAAVLEKYYNKTGYILISDLSLLDQYEKDINKYFSSWSLIKGQQTYKCERNGLTFDLGECKMKGCKTYGEIMMRFSSCAPDCKYIIERRKAIQSNVLVCTYSFWLIQQNLVKRNPNVPNPPFLDRDFTICDEAHKVVSIVQGHFSPKISITDKDKFETIIKETKDEDEEIVLMDKIKSHYDDFYSVDINDNDRIYQILCLYNETNKEILDCIDTIMRDLGEKTERGESLSKEDKKLAFCCQSLTEQINSFKEYADIIKNIGNQNIVMNPSGDAYDTISFNCIDESHLMDKYFHKNCNNQMFMSATIGDFNEYAKECGLKSYETIDVPSTFDFSNSPIFYIPDYKLSYKEKDFTLPKIIELACSIIRMYPDKRGIIQTGSYKFAKDLYNGLNGTGFENRILLYENSEEKNQYLDIFKRNDNYILVGPTLMEGLSFDDDLCRFQIIMKVPYPSLADRFVNAKMKLNEQWYSNSTAINILQSVGRGVRNEKDWCVTFILDGCFSILAQKSSDSFNDEFKNRVQIISPSSLIF